MLSWMVHADYERTGAITAKKKYINVYNVAKFKYPA